MLAQAGVCQEGVSVGRTFQSGDAEGGHAHSITDNVFQIGF